jgi:hypothetical protein
MIRTTIIPDKQEISISLLVPENYIGKEVEVIAFSKKEVVEERQQEGTKKVTFNALSLDTRGYKFNRDEANER